MRSLGSDRSLGCDTHDELFFNDGHDDGDAKHAGGSDDEHDGGNDDDEHDA